MGTWIASIGIGLLLVVHGVAHVSIATVWGKRDGADSWLLGALGLQSSSGHVGTVLSMVALIAFIAAGLALMFHLGVWRVLAVAAAVASLFVIALFWDRQMVLGVAINVGIIAALLAMRWPSPHLLGA